MGIPHVRNKKVSVTSNTEALREKIVYSFLTGGTGGISVLGTRLYVLKEGS